MAIATTLSSSAIGYSIYSILQNVQTTSAQDPHTKVVYASDGTHISTLLATNSSSVVRLLRVIGTSDGGSTLTTSNVAISSTITLDAPTGSSSAGWNNTTFNIQSNVTGNAARAAAAPIAIDTSDNLYIPLISSQGTNGEMAIYKVTKPTGGWAAWVAAGGTTTLTTTKMVSHVFASGPVNTAKAGHIYSAYWTNNGYLVFHCAAENPNSQSFAFLVFNATTGAFLGNNTSLNGYANTYFGVNDTSVPYLGAPGGGFTFFAAGTTTNTQMFNFVPWQINNAGTISVSINQISSYLLGTQVTYANGGNYTNACMITWVDTNKFMIITKNNTSPYKMWAGIIGLDWNSGDNRPGGAATSISITGVTAGPTEHTAGNQTGAYLELNWAGVAQAFPEERIVRIYQTSSSTVYYQDINYDSGFTAITYEAAPFTLATGVSGTGALSTLFEAAWDNKMVYYGMSNSGAVAININYQAQNANRAITFSVPTTGPVGSIGIPSPTSSINAVSGIGISVAPSATSSGGGHGTLYWGRFTPLTTGYRLKRVNGATTDYLVASSGTFSTEATNSVSTTANTVVLTLSNQWTNATTYTVSFATASNCGVVPYGTTRTIVTTTPSAAPASPTPRRFYRGTLAASTLGHEQTFDNNSLVNRISAANKGTSATTFAIQVGDVYLVAPTTVNVGETLVVDTSQRVDAGDRTYLTSGASSTLDVYISGTEGI
jgi:hypothetical protein